MPATGATSTTAASAMSAADARKLEKRVMPDGREAPELLVAYLCGTCGHREVLDAYDGPPSCKGSSRVNPEVQLSIRVGPHSLTFMRALHLARGGQ